MFIGFGINFKLALSLGLYLSTLTMKNPYWKQNDAEPVVPMTLQDPWSPFCVFALEKKIYLLNKGLINYKFYFSNVQPWEADAIIFSGCIAPLLCS